MEQRDRDHARHLARESDDTVVFIVGRDTKCARCEKEMLSGTMITIQDDNAICLNCAELGDLVVLPSGDPAITRRAGKISSRRAVVLQWARKRKRYERRGTLVEESAIIQATAQCAADADKRAAKNARAAVKRQAEEDDYQAAFLGEVTRMFPGCPRDEAVDIARHACEKYSGRVGRSAAAKQLDPETVRLAVIAHIRHVHTGYDRMLDTAMMDKQEVRRLVRGKIDRVMEQWEFPARQRARTAD